MSRGSGVKSDTRCMMACVKLSANCPVSTHYLDPTDCKCESMCTTKPIADVAYINHNTSPPIPKFFPFADLLAQNRRRSFRLD